MRALVADLQRHSLDDGPGIRSTVFFKGCVLACSWCQNPECLARRPELQRRANACLGCAACAGTCRAEATRFVGAPGVAARRHDRGRCRLCGACVEACPAAALRVVGTEQSVEQLVEQLLVDEPFYRSSGGGVTLSGGEATLQLDVVVELARALGERGVHVLLETCGLFDGDAVEQRLLPHLGMIYFDVKLADPAAHERHTGRDNAVILDNLSRLARVASERLLPRVPLVPEITDGETNLRAIAGLLRERGLRRVALLPYNPLWVPKRAELGLELRYRRAEMMSREEIARCRLTMVEEGLAVV